MKRILVTGVSGMLGLNFSLQAAERYDVHGVFHRNHLKNVPFELVSSDLTQLDEVDHLLDIVKPDIVLNCAAITRLDVCELHKDLALQVNADLPGRLARATAQRGIFFAHISTDGVFDGRRGSYSEEDVPNPINTYARTKFEGEQRVLEANQRALIARIVFYGCSLSGERSLAEFFYNHFSKGQSVRGFADVNFCPLLVNQLSEILAEMIDQRLEGLYHVVSSECLSKYEFGVLLARTFGFSEELITPISWQDADLRAERATNLSLCTDKIQLALGKRMPTQAEGFDQFYRLIQDGYPRRIQSYKAIKEDVPG
jgi:dTDP-4-dehydrorhamnose reductase